MTNALKEAIAKVATLPEATQDKIGEELLLMSRTFVVYAPNLIKEPTRWIATKAAR
jgi:hypothetical protein